MNKIVPKEKSPHDKPTQKPTDSGGWWCFDCPTPISMRVMTSLFPFKSFHGWAESSEVIFGDTESRVSPRLLTFWLKAPVLSTNIYLSSINFWSQMLLGFGAINTEEQWEGKSECVRGDLWPKGSCKLGNLYATQSQTPLEMFQGRDGECKGKAFPRDIKT